MSICPENDIHSVYLDDELNSPYKEQYLEHLQNCSSCTEKLNKLKAIRNLLAEDSKKISLSEEQLSDSYQKLSSILKFRNITNKSTKSSFTFFNKVIPAMAAALIIAIVLPIRIITGGIVHQELSVLANSNNPKLFTERGIIADDSIAQKATSPLLVSDNNNVLKIDNIFMPKIDSKTRNLNFVVNTLPHKNSNSTFNMYNNEQSLYNVTYIPMVGFEY